MAVTTGTHQGSEASMSGLTYYRVRLNTTDMIRFDHLLGLNGEWSAPANAAGAPEHRDSFVSISISDKMVYRSFCVHLTEEQVSLALLSFNNISIRKHSQT